MSQRSIAAGNGSEPDDKMALYVDACIHVLTAERQPAAARLLSLEQPIADSRGRRSAWESNRHIARELWTRNKPRIRALDLPAALLEQYETEFDRLRDAIASESPEHFSFTRPRLLADLRVLALRRIPVGIYDLDISGIPRSLLARQGAAGAIRLAWTAWKSGGFAPYFTQHLVSQRVTRLSPEEHERFLRLAAEVLSRRPAILGLVSTAWYNDPAIARITPRLAFLRKRIEHLGPRVFPIGSSTTIVEDAIESSETRRKLYETGEYRPTAYLGLIPRTRLLNFVASGASFPVDA